MYSGPSASQIEFSEYLRPGGNGRTHEEGRRVLRRFDRGQEGARVFQGTLGPLPHVLPIDMSFRIPIARCIAAESRGALCPSTKAYFDSLRLIPASIRSSSL